MTSQRCLLLALVGLLATGCITRLPCAQMNFAELPRQRPDRVDVMKGIQRVASIRDADQISRIVAFTAQRTEGWNSPWYGVPVGDLTAQFFAHDVFLSDFSAGPDFFEAQGCSSFQTRRASTAETAELRALLGQ